MDNRAQIREFLVTRRAKLKPEDVGLPDFGTLRRVPGLRREEVALLAGVSVEYYTRLERGAMDGVSESVLNAIVRALRLDEAEREHLFDLAHAAAETSPRSRRRKRKPGELSPSLQRLLEGITGLPAFIRNGRLDVLAINELGRALYSEAYVHGEEPVNLARFCFLDRRSRNLYPDWQVAADTAVELLHTEAGRDPDDTGLTELVGELSARSTEFRTLWAKYDVRLHTSGYKDFRHPVVGDLHLSMDALELPAAKGLTLTAYSADPNTPSEPRLRALADWAANDQQPAENEVEHAH